MSLFWVASRMRDSRDAFIELALVLGLAAVASAQPAEQPPPASDTPATTPQPIPTPPAATPSGSLLTSIFGPQRPAFVRQRLTRVPDMFGDFVGGGVTLSATEQFTTIDGNEQVVTTDLVGNLDVPLAGPMSRLKISDFNKALPVDRVFFFYNHFHNALQNSTVTDTGNGPIFSGRPQSIDRYTFGIEKTFFDGQASIEMRLPLFGDPGFVNTSDPNFPSATTGVSAGSVGNFALILKQLLFADDDFTFAAGLGIETPTGDDTKARVGQFQYKFANNAVLLHPWLGFMLAPEGNFFLNGFLHCAVPLNGNEVRQVNLGDQMFNVPSGRIGILNDQTLLFADLGLGVWLVGPRPQGTLRSLAGIFEFHYTGSLQSADQILVSSMSSGGSTEAVTIGQRRNHFDIVNLTTGLQCQLGQGSFLRVAGSFPARPQDNRFFDAEVLVNFTQLY